MRSDMSNVIVERPRLRFPLKNGSAYPRGRLENRWAPNFEDAPRTEPMGGFYAEKLLNENLQPLVRFLRSRVGRKWDDVYSEISARISCRSAVQKHVLDHLRDFVAKHVILDRGAVFALGHRGLHRLESRGMRSRFYVHPETRILHVAPTAARKGRRRPQIDPDRRVLSRDRELRRVHGVWYEIEVAPIPSDSLARAACFDVLERSWLSSEQLQRETHKNALWKTGRYAARKRQLSTREIVRRALRDKAS